ncbi:MAG: sugar phosphate isomerase/epimerase [Candidatus Omnitrophota bacterium]|nr:MAG: sugar phosphate isomerase/epimerase [Candidatus Omnitrophota bacterium]
MKVGINLLLWTANPTVENFALLDTLKAWGFDGAEFPMFDPSGRHWAELGKHCDEVGLGRTVCLCVPADANPVSPDAAVRKAAIDFLKKGIDCAHELGARLICGPFYAPVGHLVGRGRTDDEFHYAVEVIREAAEYAAKAKIDLAHEPLNRFETYVINSQEDGCKLVDAVGKPNFGLHFDTFHSHIEEKNIGKAIRNAGKRILHVHISENDRSTPGTGLVHWAETFSALKAIGYNRWMTIEAFGRALPEVAAATCIWRKMFENEEQLAKDGLKFIRKSWAE